MPGAVRDRSSSQTSAPTQSSLSPQSTASRSSGAQAVSRSCRRTLAATKVPEESLKSSAMRPRKDEPLGGIAPVGEGDRVAAAEVVLLVEDARRGRGRVEVSRARASSSAYG